VLAAQFFSTQNCDFLDFSFYFSIAVDYLMEKNALLDHFCGSLLFQKNPACQDIFWPENPNDEWLKKTRVQYIIYSIRCVTHISSWGGKRDGKKSSPSAQNLRVTAISTRGIPKIFWKFYLCIYFKIYICNVYIYMALARKFKRTFLSQRLFFHFSLPSPWKGIDLKCPRRVLWKDNLIKTQLKDFVELHKWFFAKFWL